MNLADKLDVARESFLAGRDSVFRKSLKPLYKGIDNAAYFKTAQKKQMKDKLFRAAAFIGKADRGEGVASIDKAKALITYGKEDLLLSI